MWIDALTETNWVEKFKFESYPQMLVLNPGKRKRYALLEEELNYS